MLQFLNILLTLAHLLVIGFNLLGWIRKSTRKLHLIGAGITLACWLLLGIWYGIGYCPLTDWHWQVKERLGETKLPASFIKYAADGLTGENISALLIDYITGISFGLAIVASVYVNFFKPVYKRVSA
ncbi:MAG: hypothetical protein K0S09_1875 [Sphingobacteriaceae bacterium]|jgi:hypothetical protein|nr:hypothetical protein [Sphingobacteriaceae bacterium]